MLQILRRVGGSLVVAIPKEFIERNGLTEGSQVELRLVGKKMTVTPSRPRYGLADLMSEMPDDLPRVEGWDEMPPLGEEND